MRPTTRDQREVLARARAYPIGAFRTPRSAWPRLPRGAGSSARTCRLLGAFLLWSLRTIVSWPELEIVVVDNGSQDGSAQLLAEAERGGVCTLLANHDNRHHGPGLNQGISYLASPARATARVDAQRHCR